MHEAVAAIAGCGVSPIVRIPANEGWMVKSNIFTCDNRIWQLIRFCEGALDSGAHGIIVPLIYTADDTIRLLKSAKFPPQGQRGFGSPFPMERFGIQTTTEYLHQANDALLTIVQIETKEALQNIDAIARTAVDCLFIGPFDLGNNIGHPIIDGKMDDELHEAIATIQRSAKEHDKSTGIYCTSGDQARQYADQGFHMISVAADMIALPTYLTSALTSAKGSYVHSALNIAKGAAAKMTGPYGR
ncbi:hypothetical protein MMC18_004903 [Xylographa bjoerkii]|nr:hypothetical protein [Xylographa bjoerkii]